MFVFPYCVSFPTEITVVCLLCMGYKWLAWPSSYGSLSSTDSQLNVTQGHFSLALPLTHIQLSSTQGLTFSVWNTEHIFHWAMMTGKCVQMYTVGVKSHLDQGSIRSFAPISILDTWPVTTRKPRHGMCKLNTETSISIVTDYIWGEKVFSKEHAQHISEMHNKIEESNRYV